MNCNHPIEHTVKAGDTLYKLSKQYKTTVSSIILGNSRVNPYNLQVGMKLTICPGEAYMQQENAGGRNDLKERMRLAWLNHVYWTRMFLVSVAGGIQDQQEIVNRLLENVDEIVDLFARYYPQNEVRELRDLLTTHVELVGGLVTMEKDKETARIPMQLERLEQNAAEIAKFLAGATPEYNESELKDMLDMHLDLTKQQIEERMAGDYEKDIDTFGKIQKQAIMMADYLTEGLQKEARASGI